MGAYFERVGDHTSLYEGTRNLRGGRSSSGRSVFGGSGDDDDDELKA